MLSLLAIAVAPGICIILYIYSKDKYNREPAKNLIISFLLGMASIFPAILIERQLRPVMDGHFSHQSLSYYFLFAFGVVAFSEEFCKFLMLRLYAFRLKAFDEPLDGIIYSVMISMGFATLENINYVADFGFMTGLLRMFLSVPAHASFGVLMGYHIGLAKFDPQESLKRMVTGLFLAVFFHGAFDFFLFLQDNPRFNGLLSHLLLVAGALASYWIAIRISLRSIRLHQELSHQVINISNLL